MSEMQDEKAEAVDDVGPGAYTAVLADIYDQTTQKQNKPMTCVDFLLTTVYDDRDTKTRSLMVFNGGKLAFRKDTSGLDIIQGCYYTLPLFKPDPNFYGQAAMNMFVLTRRKFSRAMGALNEETNVISWKMIQAMKGTPLTFVLRKDKTGKYLNMDMDSLAILGMGAAKVDPGVVDTLMLTVKKFEEAKYAKREHYKAPSSAPSMDDEQPPQKSAKKEEEDDLPF